MAKAVIALGSNLGRRRENLERAINLFAQNKCEILARSKFYNTAPVGFLEQADFLNGAILIETEFAPLELLKLCNKIESELGRVRTFKNAPRTIDLDIIFYENVEMRTDDLTIPHALWQERDFVITPLLDLLDTGALSLKCFNKYTDFLSQKTRKYEVCNNE